MHLIRAAAGILAGGCAGRAGRHKGVARVVLAAWSRTCRRAMHLGCLVSTLSRVTPDGWRRQSGQDANNEPPVQVPVLRRVREEGRARVEGGQLAQVPRRGRGPAARPGLRPPAAAAAAASAQQGQAHAHGPRCAGPRTDEREGEEPQVAKINCKESLWSVRRVVAAHRVLPPCPIQSRRRAQFECSDALRRRSCMAAPFPVAGPPPGYSGHQHPHPAVIGAAYEPQQGAAYPAQPLVQPHGAPYAPAAPQGYAQAPPQVYGQVRSSLCCHW